MHGATDMAVCGVAALRCPPPQARTCLLQTVSRLPAPIGVFAPPNCVSAGGFVIESPRDFAAHIYSLMEGASGAAASSGSGSSGSSSAAPTVDPEVL